MSKIVAAITGVGGYVPEYRLTNAELETMVETNDEWIRSRTGIEERRILKGEGLGTSDMVVKAVEDLFEKTGTKPEEIDFVLCATTTPDMQFPATANIVADKLGILNAFGYDLNAACSGFLYAITTGAKFVESGQYKKALVIGADKMSSIINYEDRRTCIIFGDGAGAVLLEPSEEGNGVIDAELKSDGSGRVYLHKKAGGSLHPFADQTVTPEDHYVFQDGRPVFKAAVSNMSKTVKLVMERNGVTHDSLNWLVPHQANKRIIDAVGKMADIDASKVMVNIQKYGNTTNATIPLCLWEYEPQLKKGDNLLLTAFGGGFTWGAVYVKWAYDGSKS